MSLGGLKLHYETGSFVWILDEVERYLPAKVINTFAPGEQGLVRTEDGEDRLLSPQQTAEVLDCNQEALNSSISDLVNISDLNEMSILHNLRIRYKEDTIYTNISSILISVNPFKLLPLYTPEVLDSYRNGSRDKPPHVFAIAYNSYHNMLNDVADQSVVISGESGAGKSEATKLILQFLTDVSGKVAGHQAKAANDTLEQQILAANPILEAFGNAKTLRNNNSSRFGKLITVNFDSSGGIIGGNIINYLLEKSRIVGQTKGERNYHIFYQLLSCVETDPFLAEKFKLANPELFEFTSKSGVIYIEGVSDEKDFEEFTNSMNILQFSAEDIETILKIVAGVLHFGNLKFKAEKIANAEDGASIVNPDVLTLASSLWGVDPDNMANFLTHRNIGARESILVSYSVSQAEDARDAMVKRVYADLFQFVVDKINLVLSSSGKKRTNFIGVLDIFGFESFVVNSFEQLCINYCNEKLQFHFNEHIFRMEQTIYAAEGISIAGTSFVDNQPTLDMLELKATGIFSMCDEEINVPKGSDDGFLAKVLKGHSAHPNLQKPKPKDCQDFTKCFGVVHYAGLVFYNVSNFLEKNKDQLHSDIQGVLRCSNVSLISNMFTTPIDLNQNTANASGRRTSASGGKAGNKTLGGQFKQQLHDLITTLNSTFPHFVRCMKPNDNKAGNQFNAQRMQDQLRYAGLVEVCRIRKLGYPVRRTFEEFYKRFRCCDPTADNFKKLIASLESQAILKNGEWAIGHTKIFMRTQQSFELELAREAAFLKVVISVQKVARRFVYRKRYHSYLKLIQNVNDAVSQREALLASCSQVQHLSLITSVLEMSFELPWGGTHLAVIKTAKLLQSRLKDEIRVSTLLDNAIAAVEINALKNAVSAADSLSPVFHPPSYDKAIAMIERLTAEQEIRDGLIKAMEYNRSWMKRDLLCENRDLIRSILDNAAKLVYECDETRQAVALLSRLKVEESALDRLAEAVLARDVDLLKASLDECLDLGLESEESIDAQILYDQLQAEIAARIAAELAEKQRLAEEAERKRLEEEAERQRLADEAEKKRLAEEAEKQRLAFEAEKKRLEDEAERQKEEEARKIAEHNEKLRHRAQVEENTKKMLIEASEKKNLKLLNDAIQEAIQFGLHDDELEKANALRAKLQVFEDVKSKLTAAYSMPKLERGISENEVLNLDNAIKFAEKADIPADWIAPFLSAAKEEQAKNRNFSTIKNNLQDALQSGDRVKLRDALDKAENLDMQDDVVASAKKVFRDSEIAHRESLAKEDASPVEDYDQVEKARAIRNEIARQARFDVKNFPGLRTAEDFAKGIILSKSKVKEGFLVWSGNVIPKSLIDLPKESNKVAIQIFKDLLGYMGDKQMPFPAMLAQDILRKGFEYKVLRDEIYMQIIKQITFNPRTESQAKGWQMLCMCLITFPPSVDFENFLLHFLLEKFEKGRGAVQDYARYCVRSLEGMLSSGEGSGFVPSVEEIQAYKERPPILATIELVDGNIIAEDLPITPDFTVGKVLEICTGWLDLKDHRANMFGIFVYDLGETDESRSQDDPYSNAAFAGLPRTPRPLKNDDFMGDVIVQKSRQKRKYKFVMKKKIYLPQHNWRGNDPHYERLIYLQAEDEAIIKGNIPFEEERQVIELSCISFAVAFGADFPTTVDEMIQNNVTDFIMPSWRNKRSAEDWAGIILKNRNRLLETDTGDLQEEFIKILSESQVYGTHWFYVRKVTNAPAIITSFPDELLLGFNNVGMHAYNLNRKLLASFAYADIYRWGGSASQFSLIIWDANIKDSFELIVSTSQAADMAASILDHIRAIMSTEEA